MQLFDLTLSEHTDPYIKISIKINLLIFVRVIQHKNLLKVKLFRAALMLI